MMFAMVLITLLIPIFGQFGRFSFGGGGILLLDIFLPLLLCFWFFWNAAQSKNPFTVFWNFPLARPITLVLFILWASLLYNAFWFDSFRIFIEGAFYALRYTGLLLFSVVVWDVFSHTKYNRYAVYAPLFLGGIAGALALLGFFQLWWYPDFAKMAEQGWDPHIGRLLSTWFDPNFLGSFFSYILILLIFVMVMRWRACVSSFSSAMEFLKKDTQTKYYSILVLILLFALLLTYSRSAMLAFVIPFFIGGIIYFRLLLMVIIGICMIILPFSDRAMQRISDGISSAFSITEKHSLFMPDATARLRVENFQEGLSLANQHFYTGIGFNTIRAYKTENIHSSGGFDSSLLTVFVTSGIFGLASFLFLHWYTFFIVLQKTMRLHDGWEKGFGVGILLNFFGIFAQSFFINSLFYSFFILFFWACIGFFLAQKS